MSGKSMIISPAGKILVQAGGADDQIISWEIAGRSGARAGIFRCSGIAGPMSTVTSRPNPKTCWIEGRI